MKYYNQSINSLESFCGTNLISVVASHRQPSGIGFFIINGTSCTYIPSGVGRPANVLTNTSANCLSMVSSRASITLEYSQYNHTTISPYHMAIDGNAAYFRSCPIAVDIS